MDSFQLTRPDEDSRLPAPCALWPVDMKLTHVDCNPGDTLVHFQGQYVTICELDYNILQVEIQNALKTKTSPVAGQFCLVEDVLSNHWFRGRVQDQRRGLFDVFLLDYGNILTVDSNHLASISDDLLILPPKIVCGFFANVLPLQECWESVSQKYFCSMIGTHVKGYIHAFLPYKVLILEAPELTKDLLRLKLGRHVDTDTFLLLVEILLEVPIQQTKESVPDLLIEKQNAQEFSFRSSSLMGFENFFSFSGSKLIVGQKERARVTAAVNSGLFYCQLSSAARDLNKMSEKLALVCESRLSSQSRDKPVENLGLFCAVKGKDEKWHRGFVQCLPVNSQVRVVFVDYGYCEAVKVQNVFQLPSDFLLMPIMAYPCLLSCLRAKDEDTKRQQQTILRDALLGKELEFTVDGFCKEQNVFLVTLNTVDCCAQVKTVHSVKPADSGIFNCQQNFHPNYPQEVKTIEGIQVGSVFEGYVEHVQNPDDFWIRQAERNESFERMMNKLTDYISGLQLNEDILEDPVPGVLCCAMYEQDMHYYRAVVVDILENGAEVFFIDFGNTEKVPCMLIKKLPSEFAVEPHFALNCSLAHVAPVEDVWTVATEFFRKSTLNKALLVHVLHKKNDKLVVELCERQSEKRESIATCMVNASVAEYWRYNLTVGPSEPGEEETFGKRKHAEDFRKVVSKKLNGKVTMQKPPFQDHTETPKSKGNSADAFKHEKIEPGFEISVLCSHVVCPSDFWCQNKKQKENLDRLMEKLQSFYQKHNPALQLQSTYCAVNCKLDNRWYRGCNIGVKNEEADVILVDYGMVVKEKLQNIRALMPEFLELEAQAFRCSLYNLIEPDQESVWSKEASILLKDFVSRGSANLKCKVYSKIFVKNTGLFTVVDLHMPLQQTSASEHLVQKGVALKIMYPKELVPSATLYSFVYSSFSINIGSEELVYPTHVDSPWEIYLQLDRNSAVFDELVERIAQESKELLSQTHGPNIGTVCLAKYFGDSKWYRSLVWPAQSSQHLNVFFVDYGNKQVAEKSNVLPIPRKAVDLLFTPMQALRCSLSGVPEGEHLPEVKTWLEKTILNRTLQAKFGAKDNSGHLICDLFDGNVHINEKVKELFAIHEQKDSNSIRIPINGSCKDYPNASSSGKKPVTKQRRHVKTATRLETSNHTEKVIQRQRNSQSYQKKHFKRCQSKNKSKNVNPNLSGSLSKTDPRKVNHDQKCKKQVNKVIQMEECHSSCASSIQSSKALPKMVDLPDVGIKPGFKGVGFISHCESMESFFIQMENDEQNILKMGEDLNSSSFTEDMESVTSEINVGDLVAAEYEEDLALYRAVVTSVTSSGALSVEFVDYGNTTTVNRNKIYQLTSQYLSQSRLSVPCTLLKPHLFAKTETFIQETNEKPLMVKFVQNIGSAWEVDIKISDRLLICDDEMVPVSEQCKPSKMQENGKVTVAKDGLTWEKPKSEMSGMKEAKETSQASMKFKNENNNMVEQKSLDKKQNMRAPDCKKDLITKTEHNACNGQHDEKLNEPEYDPSVKPKTNNVCDLEIPSVSEICQNFGKPLLTKSVGIYGQCVGVEESLSVVDKSTLVDSFPEERKEDQIQHLFFSPVKMDFKYLGFAASISTPCEFYIVLEDFLLMKNAVSRKLKGLPELLSPLPETHLIPGAGCLVNDEKHQWCRGEIKRSSDISVIIHLVDHGQSVHIPRTEVGKLKILSPELAALPKITYPCLLRGIKPTDEIQWSESAITFFKDCMSRKNLQIYFMHYVSEAQWEVEVVTGDRHIAKELVDAGYAHYKDCVLGIRFQQRLGHNQVSQGVNSKILPSVPDIITSGHEPTQLKKEELSNLNLQVLWSVDNEVLSREEVHSREGDSHHHPASGVRQCLLM